MSRGDDGGPGGRPGPGRVAASGQQHQPGQQAPAPTGPAATGAAGLTEGMPGVDQGSVHARGSAGFDGEQRVQRFFVGRAQTDAQILFGGERNRADTREVVPGGLHDLLLFRGVDLLQGIAHHHPHVNQSAGEDEDGLSGRQPRGHGAGGDTFDAADHHAGGIGGLDALVEIHPAVNPGPGGEQPDAQDGGAAERGPAAPTVARPGHVAASTPLAGADFWMPSWICRGGDDPDGGDGFAEPVEGAGARRQRADRAGGLGAPLRGHRPRGGGGFPGGLEQLRIGGRAGQDFELGQEFPGRGQRAAQPGGGFPGTRRFAGGLGRHPADQQRRRGAVRLQGAGFDQLGELIGGDAAFKSDPALEQFPGTIGLLAGESQSVQQGGFGAAQGVLGGLGLHEGHRRAGPREHAEIGADISGFGELDLAAGLFILAGHLQFPERPVPLPALQLIGHVQPGHGVRARTPGLLHGLDAIGQGGAGEVNRMDEQRLARAGRPGCGGTQETARRTGWPGCSR